MRDDLTGLLKKETIEKEFKSLISQAKEDQIPLTLAAVDIDTFMVINLEHGHKIGDVVLIELARTLQDFSGEDTLVFRSGGDEYLILFPNTTREQAFIATERIRAETEQRETYGEAQVQVTIRAGIASYPIDGTAMDELLRKADQAMYRAEETGGNQVLLAYDEKMIPKTTHFTETQLERLSKLAEEMEVTEARLLREALDDLIKKYKVTEIES